MGKINGSADLTKETLYKAVKALVENDSESVHLHQQKLFTLFSIGLQYLLFRSTKEPGAYIVRIEDAPLAEKLAKRAKDLSSRKFFQALVMPRKLRYGRSTFHLDFFHMGTWGRTCELPKAKIKGALIVKNTIIKPMMEIDPDDEDTLVQDPLLFFNTIREVSPKTIIIGHGGEFPSTEKIHFDFIPDSDEEKALQGVKINTSINLKD
ncbi:MAG: hypothetical protein HOE90_17360 [Bacteriovoracaceae bacterium]|jgi:hypothetical protein|nr:hypothetical protein [Bacteriovoracaceae bacterium]